MIIGISAKLHCGKTVLANMFMSTHPEYTRLAFGDLLKRECSETYDYPLEWNYSEDGKEQIINHPDLPRKDMTVREVLQWHGTEFRREQDPDYWVTRMETVMLTYPSKIMIDDVRFKNEAKLIKDREGLLIRLHPYLDWEPGESADHRSETDLDDYADWDLIFAPEFGKLETCLSPIEVVLRIKEKEKHG